MNKALLLAAVDNLRKILHEKAAHRRLMTKDLVDAEVYLQQIILEVSQADRGSSWIDRVKDVF